jgi:hypothetical protein
MPLAQRLDSTMTRMGAFMEASPLLTNIQRGAGSGPNKVSADKIRGQFPEIAKAAAAPYLGLNPAADSTTNLHDDTAAKLPLALKKFLPEDQQGRLVVPIYTRC